MKWTSLSPCIVGVMFYFVIEATKETKVDSDGVMRTNSESSGVVKTSSACYPATLSSTLPDKVGAA